MYQYKAIVERVVDGDTIDVMADLGFHVWTKQRLRLYGIDAYESRTRDLEEKKKGLAAKAFVENRCPVGNSIIVEITKLEGKYGRAIAKVYTNNIDDTVDISINDQLVNEGLAVYKDY